MDSNPSKEDSNPNSKKCNLGNLKKEIRIPMEWIRIPILVSLPIGQDLNPKGMDSNLDSKKDQEGLDFLIQSNLLALLWIFDAEESLKKNIAILFLIGITISSIGMGGRINPPQ